MKKLFLVLALLILTTQGAFAACNTGTDAFDTDGWCIDTYGVLTPKLGTEPPNVGGLGGEQNAVEYFANPQATYDTLTAYQSGHIFVDMGGVTSGAGSGSTYILPAASAGLVFNFVVGSQTTVTIDTLSASDTIYGVTPVVAGNGIKNSSKVTGDSIELLGVATGKWVIKNYGGTWVDTGKTRG
jgi:hypothetical protein